MNGVHRLSCSRSDRVVAWHASVNQATVFKMLQPDTRTASRTYYSVLNAGGIDFSA